MYNIFTVATSLLVVLYLSAFAGWELHLRKRAVKEFLNGLDLDEIRVSFLPRKV